MDLSIELEDPLSEDGRKLIAQSLEAMAEVYSEEESFALSAESLASPDIEFYIARAGGAAAGCVALKSFGEYGEVKSLFVMPEGRGLGAAKALMAHLERRADEMGIPVIRLETGDRLKAAVSLYKSIGYRVRGPFGDYELHPASMFMEKRLA